LQRFPTNLVSYSAGLSVARTDLISLVRFGPFPGVELHFSRISESFIFEDSDRNSEAALFDPNNFHTVLKTTLENLVF
jgi:hypothetical protein